MCLGPAAILSLRTRSLIVHIMAKTALVYPKMPGSRDAPAGSCIAFEKYDGTNIHWAWDATLGWHAFGTRRDRFDLDDNGIAEFNSSHPGLEDCSGLFLNSLEPLVTDVFYHLRFARYAMKEPAERAC